MTSGFEAALDRLPDAYATTLRLVADGVPDDQLAAKLGIEPEGLTAMVDLARQKLAKELTRTQVKGRSLS